MDPVPPAYDAATTGGSTATPAVDSANVQAPAPATQTQQPVESGSMYPPAQPVATGIEMCAPGGSATPADKEAELKARAVTQLIPEWERRLANAMMIPIPIEINLDELIADVNDPKTRLKALRLVLTGTTSVVGQGLALAKQESTLALIEALVQAIEKVSIDATVRSEIASQMQRIRFVSTAPERKSVNLEGGALVYRAAFATGQQEQAFSKKEILEFFELGFFAQERELVNRFAAEGLPPLIERLHRAIGTAVAVQFDIPGMVTTCSQQSNRLNTTRTIITRTKLTDKAAVHAKTALSLVGHHVQSLANKANSLPPPEREGAPKQDPVNSPNVLVPLVEAIEFCCQQHETVRASIASVVQSIVITMTPGTNLVANLSFHQSLGEPEVKPSPLGVPPIQNGVLVYNGCFEAGHKGCFTKSTIVDIFEAHFRCREKGFVHQLMEMSVPEANARLSSVVGQPVDIEVQWTTIFLEKMTMNQRLDVAETLAGHNSQFVIQPMVQAISTVIQKIDEAVPQAEAAAGAGLPNNPVKQRIARVVIRGIEGSTAKPGLQLLPLAQGTDMRMALTYTCAFERGTPGCFDVTDFKATLRGLFGIETPSDEKGVSAMLSKADATVTKMTTEVTKKLTKMKFW